jgi:ribonuclease H2 subunit B
MLEVQAVVPPNTRSWFVGTQDVVAGVPRLFLRILEMIHCLFVDGKLLLITQVDPTFLLIPVLQSIQPVCNAKLQSCNHY